MIRPAKIATILMKAKKIVGRSQYRKKEEAKTVIFWFEKKNTKGGKHIAPIDFAEHLKKSDVPVNSKVYYGPFLRNGLYERHCYISKSRWNVQYLEVC